MWPVGGTVAFEEVDFRLHQPNVVALALRLAAHEVVTRRTETPPVLLLDDVFSELDPERSDALVATLPPGQTTRAISATPLAGSGTKKITSGMTATSNMLSGKGSAMASP